MRLRYIYSACNVIETRDARILSDPWFTPGAYDGSWFQYPLIEDPIRAIGPVDLIYVSHIHPDHYDPAFLSRYLAAYPKAELVIGETRPNYLAKRMGADGFAPRIATSLAVGDTELFILANNGYEADNVDTALVVRCGGRSIVNLNDNPFDPKQVEDIQRLLPGGRPTFALLPYTGAGPYPQTHRMDEALKRQKAQAKKQQFLSLFRRYVETLQPERMMPFAGKYWLGGPLAGLNEFRGIPDATEAAALFPGRAVVLADGGRAVFDLDTMRASAERTVAYDEGVIGDYLNGLDFPGYAYERDAMPVDEASLLSLLASAYRNAFSKRALTEPYWLCLKCHGAERYFILDLASFAPIVRAPGCDHLRPRYEIHVDSRYLSGLLTRRYHWNNALIGSQLSCAQVPDVHQPQIQSFLNFLHI
jgi:UDP-MurNAc hydroxylase